VTSAIFLHDVQRATRSGNSHAIAPTFKSGHFIGYTLVLTRLDGVYYVDPLPTMTAVPELAAEIRRFSEFIAADLWALLGP